MIEYKCKECGSKMLRMDICSNPPKIQYHCVGCMRVVTEPKTNCVECVVVK